MVVRDETAGPRMTLEGVGWKWRSYQARFLDDRSRFIAVVKARQIGMSEAAAAAAVAEALCNSGRAIWLLAVNLAGAKELLLKCALWLAAFAACDPALPTIRQESTERVVLSNRARIEVLPCTKRAVRGKTGTIIWDEAAHAQDDEAMWTAIAPIIASRADLRIILISTPFGSRGVFYRAVHGELDGPAMRWSVHHVDVHRAVSEGFPKTVLELRSNFTEDGWAQEFECSFLSQAGKYFDVKLIKRCYARELPEDEERLVKKRVLAIDCASKRDSAICVAVDWDGEDGYHIHTPRVLSSAQNRREYPEQFEILCEMIDNDEWDEVHIDANGVGAGLASFLKAKYGNLIVEVIPTAQWKARHIPALKVDMQAGNVELEPAPVLTTAFNAVTEKRTSANNLVFSAPRDSTGHADGFSAALLGYAAVKRWPDKEALPPKIARGRAARSKREAWNSLR